MFAPNIRTTSAASRILYGLTALYTNHLPRVGASDAGTWRRLIVIPFNAKIEGSSDIKNYTEYLVQNAGEAVMQWIIEGARQVIASEFHLSIPACVKAAVKAYRDSNDWLGNFLAECCDVAPEYKEKSGSVYQESAADLLYQHYAFDTNCPGVRQPARIVKP